MASKIGTAVRMVVMFAVLLQLACAKPTDLSVIQLDNPTEAKVEVAENERPARSPQFGLIGGDYDDYEDYEEDTRHFKLGHKIKHHKVHHKPVGLVGGHGCRGHGCGGYPGQGGYYEHNQGGHGGSFATASAGSAGSAGGPYGGHNEANAQSASFSFGPYSASFSVAQSSSGNQHY